MTLFLRAYLAQISSIRTAISQVPHSETLEACASSRNIASISLSRRKFEIKNNTLQSQLYLIEFPVCHVAVHLGFFLIVFTVTHHVAEQETIFS